MGKDGLVVKAPWPVTDNENKILTRQAKLLRDSLKQFRAQAGKAKKGWTKATILLSDDYPQWKIDTLLWMQTQYQGGAFPATFMKDLKTWAGQNVTDKKLVKLTMQFASFRKRETEDVGEAAMDVRLPFDQEATFAASMSYMKSQLGIEELELAKLGDGASEEVKKAKIADNVEPGKPQLWMH